MKKSYTIIGVILIMIILVVIVYKGQTSNKNSNNVSQESILDVSSLFSSRDMEQTVDTSNAKYYTVSDNNNIEITSSGIYVISGTASNAVISIDVGDEDKVQLVLDGVKITNESMPCIYLKNADKLFVTSRSGDNYLAVTGTFLEYDETNTDAVIYAKDDIVFNGEGTIKIDSSDNGISCNNDIKITGGVLDITCVSDAIEAKDSIRIADGDVIINSQKDGLHAEDSKDDTTGYIYIGGGSLTINAVANCIHATTIIQINDGEITLDGWEGLEATYVQINGGNISIDSDDDCINAGKKSSLYTPTIEIVNGNIKVKIADGDTDAIDANGNIYVKGGTLDITAQNPFDYDGEAVCSGGTIIINGETVNEITK